MRSNHWLAVSVNDWIDLTSFHSKMNLHLLTSKVDNLPCLMLNSLILLRSLKTTSSSSSSSQEEERVRVVVAVGNWRYSKTWYLDCRWRVWTQKRTKKNTCKNAQLFLSTDTEPCKSNKKTALSLEDLTVGLSMRMCKVCMLQVSTLTILYWIYLLPAAPYEIDHFSLYIPSKEPTWQLKKNLCPQWKHSGKT